MAELYNKKQKVIAIVGPTATGKTALGVALCQALGGEVISADSMQIYRQLDIGTAKVRPEETQGIAHHCVDLLQPDEQFSVADFTEYAHDKIQQLAAQQKYAVLVGGTGQYVESLLKGVQFSKEKTVSGLREELAAQLAKEGAAAMYQRLCTLDPEAAENIHPNNTVRVLRALEHYDTTGRKISVQKAESLPKEPPYESLIIGLAFPERENLYQRINQRVDSMVSQGVLQEAEFVYRNRTKFVTAAQAIGYKEFFSYFEGNASLEDCIDKVKQASRKYAKRQMTWFRHMQEIQWLDPSDPKIAETAIVMAKKFLESER